LLVEQSVKVAAEIADRAAFFEKGEVQIVADAASLFDNRELLQSMFLKTGRHS
jgi:ABC-type branched-subunit amino acid transport system ATPase component